MIEKIIVCGVDAASGKTTIVEHLKEKFPSLLIEDDVNNRYASKIQDYTYLFFTKNTLFLIVSDLRNQKSGSQCTMKFPPYGLPYIHVMRMTGDVSGFSLQLHNVRVSYAPDISMIDLNELYKRINTMLFLHSDECTEDHRAAYWNENEKFIRSICDQLHLLKDKKQVSSMHTFHSILRLIEEQKM